MHCLQYKEKKRKKKGNFELFSHTHDKKKGSENLSVNYLTHCVPARNFICSCRHLTIRKTDGENGKSPENSKNDQRAGETDT